MSEGGLGVALIAGGRGTRLGRLTGGGPKALAPLAGGTLLDHQLARVAPLNPARVVVLVCHHAAAITAAVGDRAEVLVEPAPLGTAGGLALLPPGPERWLTLNIDHVSTVDLAAFCAAHQPPATACIWRASIPVDEGVVEISGGRLTAWRERPVLRLPVTTGLYLFESAALREHLDGRPLDMPALVERLMPHGVGAWEHDGPWLDAGTPERLVRAEALLGDLAARPRR